MSSRFRQGVQAFLAAEIYPHVNRVTDLLTKMCTCLKIQKTQNILDAVNIIARDPDTINLLADLYLKCSRLNKRDLIINEINEFCKIKVATCGGNNQSRNKLKSVLLMMIRK